MKKLIISTLAVVMLCLSVNAATLAYWRLEQGPNGSTHGTELDGYYTDSSGNGNDMSSWYYPAPVSAVPVATIPQSGLTNKIALNFCRRADWVGNLMCISTHSKPIDSHDFTGGFTIECASKIRSHDWSGMVNKNGKPDSGQPFNPFKLLFRYDTVGDARMNYEFMDSGSNVVTLTSTFPYQLDKWYWIACVCDSTQAWLYVKEEGDAGYDLEAGPVAVVNGIIPFSSAWAIGRGTWDGNDAVNALDGSMDEVRICDTALAPNQFLAASGGAAVSPVAYWRFEEGTNGIHQGNNDDYYADSSGNGNHMATDITPTLSTATDAVPFATVPQTGATNTMSRTFSGAVQNVGTFAAETGSSKPVESANLESFTVECMAKPNSVNWMGAVCKDGEPAWNISGWVDSTFEIKFRNDAVDNHKIQAYFWDKTTNFVECWSTFDYNPGEWYRIAFVVEGGTQASLYVMQQSDANYELEQTKTTTWAGGPIVGGLVESSYPWVIGRGEHWGRALDGFDGTIDEVRISDTALAPGQFLGAIPEPGMIIGFISLALLAFRKK